MSVQRNPAVFPRMIYTQLLSAVSRAEATPAESAEGAVEAGVMAYSQDKYQTHQAFCEHADFEIYKEQFKGKLNYLNKFYRENGGSDTVCQNIEENFNKLMKHRFDTPIPPKEPFFSDSQKLLIDTHGWECLRLFCQLMANEKIPLNERLAAIANLSDQVTECAQGATSSFIMALRDLQCSMTDSKLYTLVWRTKETLIKAVLLEIVKEHFPDVPGSEIHFVNYAWNHLAALFGLEEISDTLAVPSQDMDDDFFTECIQKIQEKMTLTNCLRWISEGLLTEFHDILLPYKPPLDDPSCEESAKGAMDRFDEALKALRQKTHFNLKMNMFSIADLESGKPKLVNDASLMAVYFLEQFSKADLLIDNPITCHGEWREDPKADLYARLCTVGTKDDELVWLARFKAQTLPQVSEQREWNSDFFESDFLTIQDLLAWQKTLPSERRGELPPLSAVQQALQSAKMNAPAGELFLQDFPPEWLNDREYAAHFFRYASPHEVVAYIEAQQSTLKDVITSQAAKSIFADAIMGVSTAASDLVLT